MAGSMTAHAFGAWLNAPREKGLDRRIYWTGFIANDAHVPMRGPAGDAEMKACGAVAAAAWRAYELGLVVLTQRRVNRNHYEYIATKTRRQK